MVAKKTIIKWMLTTLWIALGAGAIVLLVAAVHKEDRRICTGLTITIKGVSDNFFVDSTDILATMNQYIDGNPVGQPVSYLNLKSLEVDLEKNVWVKDAELFFDNNSVLRVNVTEREPVARVFTNSGASFYIDSSLAMLPLSEKLSARLPVFTGFPSDKAVLTGKDSALLRDIYQMSMAIQKDAFRMAFVEQVDIVPPASFVLVPKIGNTSIVFGNAQQAEEKFSKLLLFYQQVLPQSGLNYYSEVNVQYAGQVVAKRKGAEDKTADSLRTIQIMRSIAMEAEQRANDSLQVMLQDNEHNTTNISLIQESIQRDDTGEGENNANDKSSIKPQGIPVINNAVNSNPSPMKSVVNTAPKSAVVAKPSVPKPVIAKPVIKPVVTAPAKPKPATPVAKPVKKPVTTAPKPVAKPVAKPKPIAPRQVQPANDY